MNRHIAGVLFLVFVSPRTGPSQDTPPTIMVQGPGSQMSQTLEFGGGGRWLATLTDRGAVRILNATDGSLLRNAASADNQRVTHIGADPAGDRIALGLSDNSVCVVDVTSGKQLWRQEGPHGAKNEFVSITGLRFTADGTRLQALFAVTAAPKLRMPKTVRSLHVWDAVTGNAVDTRNFPSGTGFSADGKWLIGAEIRNLRKLGFASVILDLATLAPVGPEIPGMVVAAHAGTGRALVSSYSNGLPTGMRLVDVATGRELAILPIGFYGGAFSPDGGTIVSVGQNLGWQVFDAATGKVRFAGDSSLPMPFSFSVAFSPDGTNFAMMHQTPVIVSTGDPSQYRILGSQQGPLITAGKAASESGLIRRGSEKDLEEQMIERTKSFGSVAGSGSAASFTSDGRWLISRSADGQLDFFDAATGNKMPFRVATPPGSKEPLATSANGRYVYLKSEAKMERQIVPVTIMRQKVEMKAEQKAFSTETVDTIAGRIMGKVDFHNIRCLSGGGEYAVELLYGPNAVQRPSMRSAAGGPGVALPPGMDFSAGCSISADGKYLAVASASGQTPKSGTSGKALMSMEFGREDMFGDRFGFQKTQVEIYDVAANRTIATLLDAQGKPGKYPFSASSLRWTSGGRFLVGGGQSGLMSSYIKHGPVRFWETATGREVRVLPGSEAFIVLGVSPDASLILTQTANTMDPSGNFGVDARDAVSGAIRSTLPTAVANSDALVFSPDGRVILGPDSDGALSIWSRADGVLLGQLRSLQEGEWLIVSKDGLFDGSPRGWSLISWHDDDHKLQTAPGEIYFNEFYRPGLLADLLEGHAPALARALTSIDRRQPALSVSAVPGSTGMATIRITATEAAATNSFRSGSGVKDLRLFRNGLLVKAWRGDLSLDAKGTVTVEATVAAPPGENRFSAYAFNAENVRSAEAFASLKAPGAPRPGTMHVLAIGVNEYANPEFNLNYASPDADVLSRELAGRQQALDQFTATRTVMLKDRLATAANIKLALARLSGASVGAMTAGSPAELSDLTPVGPEDGLVVYFAGHGIAFGDRFYLIPHDLGYNGPRSEVRANLPAILEHGISDLDLQRALEPVAARHIVLIIDACQSGQALASDDDRRGPMNSRGLAQLAWEKGMSILAASEAYQAALESSRLGHGFLTFALAEEALKTPAADSAPIDGVITEPEWLQYAARRVPQLQIEAMESARQANRLLTLEVLPGNAASARLQSPRLFTRRDLPGSVLVMAKFDTK